MQRFRGGLVFEAHRLCVSLNSRLEGNKEETEEKKDGGAITKYASLTDFGVSDQEEGKGRERRGGRGRGGGQAPQSLRLSPPSGYHGGATFNEHPRKTKQCVAVPRRARS